MAQIQSLIDAFKEDKDIHKITASQVFNIHESEVSQDLRSKAKAINFGIIYGISAFGLAKQLKISRSQAFFQEIFGESVPRGTSQSWHDSCLRKMFSKNNIKRLPKLSNQLPQNKPHKPPLKISFFRLQYVAEFSCQVQNSPILIIIVDHIPIAVNNALFQNCHAVIIRKRIFVIL